MSRWRVDGLHGDHKVLWPEPGVWHGTRWAAINLDTGMAHEFPTHAEALAYADRMARTVTVTLPRVDNGWEFNDGDSGLIVERRGMWVDVYDESGDYIVLFAATELEPTALALLAMARKEQT